MATHEQMLTLYLTDKLFENVMDAVKVFLWKINKLSNKDVNRYQRKKTDPEYNSSSPDFVSVSSSTFLF